MGGLIAMRALYTAVAILYLATSLNAVAANASQPADAESVQSPEKPACAVPANNEAIEWRTSGIESYYAGSDTAVHRQLFGLTTFADPSDPQNRELSQEIYAHAHVQGLLRSANDWFILTYDTIDPITCERQIVRVNSVHSDGRVTTNYHDVLGSPDVAGPKAIERMIDPHSLHTIFLISLRFDSRFGERVANGAVIGGSGFAGLQQLAGPLGSRSLDFFLAGKPDSGTVSPENMAAYIKIHNFLVDQINTKRIRVPDRSMSLVGFLQEAEIR